ncbi:hypothetical protein KY290_023665 [Solanum tuberosum]|uniref:Zinc finger protein n=1 Tax=Solanum tuberosum TaxID=4113 RepID=A0ABQ7V7U0_SOLTU|nr:hypothetical protein KY290_023665 [Solanum tuberosum]
MVHKIMVILNYFICFVLTLTIRPCEGKVQLPNNVVVKAVFAFGDSIVDQGNNNYIPTIAKCNFPPYGKDFNGGIPTGRFCNGKTPPDLIVEELGIKEHVPAYLDSNLRSEDLKTGVSFASGGSGYDPRTSTLASAIPLSTQLNQFKEYIGKLEGLVGEEEANYILKNSLFLVVVGSDDLANTYFTLGVRLKQDIDSYTDLMVAKATEFLQELYNLGARKIGIFGIPPIGCLPSQRTLAGGPNRGCAKEFNEAAQLANTKFSIAIDSLSKKLAQSKLVLIDIYNPFLDIIVNPQKYAKLQLRKDINITALFAFGDSIVDQGNNNNLITHAKCNFLPYGKDFMGGNKPTGRFSNARTPADMLVEDFGIKKLMPAYLDSNLKVEDLKTGVSFASGASGFDLLTPIVASALPLSVQLALFQQYIWKMNGFIGEEATKNIVKKSLYIVVAGSDDLCNTYFMLKFPRKIQYNVDSYTNLMVDGASNFINGVCHHKYCEMEVHLKFVSTNTIKLPK